MKKNHPKKKWILEFLRILLGVIFLITGLFKFFHMQEFTDAIENYQLIPQKLDIFAGTIVSLLEVVIGISLIFCFLTKLGVLITSSLMMLFIIITSITLFNGLDINCGCFIGIYNQKISFFSLVIQIIILAFSLIILKHYSQLSGAFNIKQARRQQSKD